MFKLKTTERLSRWKSFRQELSTLSIEEALVQVQNFWQSCPFIPFYLQPETTNDWPDPWQLIEENCYCDLAKCLGIVYTLHLSSHGNNLDPEIRIYHDRTNHHTYHIAYLCGGKYVINLVEAEIVNNTHIDQRLKLKYCYTAADLKLEQY
jgi:hypothetical protein